MMPATNSSLSLILIALGFLGIILSFLVPDRKKSLISIILAGVVVLTGVIQLSVQSTSRNRWKKRMENLQQNRNVNFEELRDRLKKSAEETKEAIQQPKAK